MDTKNHRATPEKIVRRAHPQVALSTVDRQTCTFVKVCGEIDIATAPALREGLLDACCRCADELVVDLSGVSFCDASGLGVLVGTRRRARLRDITLRLVAPSPPVARVLHATGLDRTFTIQIHSDHPAEIERP